MSNKRAKGCKNLHIAELKSGLSYGEPIRIYGLESISTTNQYGEFSAYSDDMQDTYVKTLSSVDVTIQLKSLPAQIESKIMGKTYGEGKLKTNVRDVAPQFAILYEITNIDGTSTYRVLYNATLTRDESSNNTQGESIETNSVTLTGKALPLPNGDVDMTIESDDESASDLISRFFNEVIL